MGGEYGIVAGMTVIDVGCWRMQLGFAIGTKLQFVMGEFTADEVSGSEFVGAALLMGFRIGKIAPNLVVPLR